MPKGDAGELEKQRSGHRERLRQRLICNDGDGVMDYEILELILCSARSRIDLKPVAKRLVSKFGSLPQVLYADIGELRQVKDVGEAAVAAIICVRQAIIRTLRREVANGAVIDKWASLIDYFRVRIGNASIEQFFVLYLGKRYCILADEVQNTGTVDEVPLYIREVVKKALLHGASYIVISHNHPSGDPKPSAADIRTTETLKAACENMGIILVDHVIVTPQRHYSFKTNGLL
ncbi:JAB domain-containing protein [Anaplasma platys]|nr:DNA repair protein RadC [Anaplasma platys]